MRKKQNQEDEQEPLGSLPKGPLVEILSRVPYRSLCRFKCVSKPWLALCSAPDILKRSPQTLSGFFCDYYMCGFCNLSGRGLPMVDPILPFLRKSYEFVAEFLFVSPWFALFEKGASRQSSEKGKNTELGRRRLFLWEKGTSPESPDV